MVLQGGANPYWRHVVVTRGDVQELSKLSLPCLYPAWQSRHRGASIRNGDGPSANPSHPSGRPLGSQKSLGAHTSAVRANPLYAAKKAATLGNRHWDPAGSL